MHNVKKNKFVFLNDIISCFCWSWKVTKSSMVCVVECILTQLLESSQENCLVCILKGERVVSYDSSNFKSMKQTCGCIISMYVLWISYTLNIMCSGLATHWPLSMKKYEFFLWPLTFIFFLFKKKKNIILKSRYC